MLLQLIFPHVELVKTIAKVSTGARQHWHWWIFHIPPPQFLVFHHPPIVILIFPPYSSQSEVMTFSKIHLPWINFINDWTDSTDFLKQSCEQHSVKGLKVTTRYVLYLPGRGCWFVILSTTDGSKEGCEGCEDCGVLSLHRLRAGGLLWRDSVQSSHYVAPTESSALVYLGSLLKQRCAMLCVLWINSFDMT